jgi:hypothetical protein
MGTTLKVKACVDCFGFNAGEHANGQLAADRLQQIFESFGRWYEYELTPGESSQGELLHDTLCGICHSSLTGDRRRHDDGNAPHDRRAQFGGDQCEQAEDRRRSSDDDGAYDRRAQLEGDRRTPFNRGSRILLASLRTW